MTLNYNLKKVVSSYFKRLEPIEKNKVNFNTLLNGLKFDHKVIVICILENYIDDDNIVTINDFKEWDAQFIAQFVYGVAIKELEQLDELFQSLKDDRRQRANKNNLSTVKDALEDFVFFKTILFIENDNMYKRVKCEKYPIASEGITYLEKYSAIMAKVNKLKAEINRVAKQHHGIKDPV